MLLRLNLATGEITEIFPDGIYHFEFSRRDKLVYSAVHEVRVLDLSTWQIQRYPLELEYCKIGDFLWSPEEDRIVFQTLTCIEGSNFEYSADNLILLNLKDGSYKQILSLVDVRPISQKWTKDNPIYSVWDSEFGQRC